MSISTRYLPVAIALSYLGTVRGDKNHREIIRIYNSVKPHGYTMRLTDPWCAAFWTACQIMAGNSQKEVPMSASCSQIIADAKALGIWQEDESVKPQVGWGVLYDWGDSGYGNNIGSPDHIGMVYDVDDKYIYVIEGNKGSGVVGKRAVAINGRYLRGFVKPKYDAMHKVSYRPKTKFVGTLPTEDVMYNKIGDNVAKLQKFLNWIDDAKLDIDKSCGAKTTQAILDFQYTYGLALDGCFGPACRAKAKALVKKYPLPQPKPKSQVLGDKADELAYKTNAKEAKYPSGKPTDAYKKALHKVYPNRSKWGKGAKAGASCDVFVGTCIRAAGIDTKFPRGLAEQIPYLKKSKKFEEVKVTPSTAKDGDIIVYTKTKGGAHICIVYKGKIKEASHDMYYPKTTPYLKQRLDKSGKKMLKVYRAKGEVK